MLRLAMIYRTKGAKETKDLAKKILNKIDRPNPKKGLVVALEGELGAGKTTFVQGLARAFKIRTKLKSPTFSLIKHYEIPQSKNFKILYHIDCYRLKDHRDLAVLGVKDILASPENIILIEWSDRIRPILPKKLIKIHIDHISQNERKLSINFY
ncbi:MAG: tRNA (adenosine(37)-N6)-threonylcarbamoyltransferase complex ATPase subunit type 1 TsaE [Candidatus Yanofskybacteria bacterium RIFCSPHIGHO2_02_FULL_44_12b]|nr:MAG: tRNA (adenosine(37)-N6)-threonylcarbamoyltransferase complex ATPase subunit type 1 TsaE [Candidatus Yanofskybacteria bacterium RIFCSPHIGHO2_01_FULL_44_24]OGN14622.1 MAG: tRNA (adenosine(37)-N6)-threonylcarbamoyltransferase complex ATPase subunit type 1 TsaE [Candidatus Yanofskybacteria bacterium RIFCSPHIGHO2_02_FULL_44_12b]OGN26546.1 MAG: tRNA (adenosine(37)-N6)-threonylcarbamoyltransferase complex ATPase subunit type 1 TsaE [Candidatus Yanofskybacteria bacterium RIFCSPLOWO2_01_FULL_44_22